MQNGLQHASQVTNVARSLSLQAVGALLLTAAQRKSRGQKIFDPPLETKICFFYFLVAIAGWLPGA
jgi:hypothetical protein